MRPLWAVYLTVTNMDAVPVTLDSLVCELEAPTGLGYRHLQARHGHLASEFPLPQAALAPGASAVIPIAVLLGPLWPDRFEPLWTEFTDLPSRRAQSVSHGDLSAAASTTSVIGPAMWPLTVRMTQDATLIASELHELNLKNVYTLSRYWECGSCPHLFAESPRGQLSYFCELFARAPGKQQEHIVIVPDDTAALVLAELEDEITVIDCLAVNGRRRSSDIRLGKGDTLRIEVREIDECTFTGHYETTTDPRSIEPWMRNQLICAFIDSCARNLHSGPTHGRCR